VKGDKFFKNVTVTVYNLYGQPIKEIEQLLGHTITLFRDNIANGMYLIQLTTENNTVIAKKIIVIN
jgi:sucrose-6-phosphate hydrolase SacC (GH32 family)